MIQDNQLLLSEPGHLDQTLRTLSSLGVQRLRITVEWGFVAPDAGASQTPAGFDGSNPADYPPGAWAPYDAIVRGAARYKLGVDFNLTGGAPLWAEPAAPPSTLANVWYPSASAFGAFVSAVGERYSGSYTPPGASAPLPRVGYWSVWNEPNVGTSSLSPQTVNGVEVGPRLYRGLLDAAYGALQATGHGRDTILIGELASTGHADPGAVLGMQPLRFVRALYCVDRSFRQLRGAAAAARGCPTTAASARFRAQNPALFQATGWSHHPYRLNAPPDAPSPRADPDWVTLADLSKLESALDRVQRAYGSRKRFPIYLTEYGYNTDPPQTLGNAVSPATQATYLNQAEYIAWRDPRVQTLSQYLLRDQPLGYGAVFTTYASGLEFLNGKPKASFSAYRLPIWMPGVRVRRGRALEVWGCVRPATRYPRSAVGPVQIQLNGRTIRSVKITNPNGYFDVHVAFPGSGNVRLVWTYPHGARIYSRTVRVTQ